MSGERLRYVLPGRSFGLPLGSPRTRLGRCFLPTSATDFHNEHPRTVRVLSARREPCRPRDLPTEIRRLPQRRAISNRSSRVAQPQVDARLTPRLQLRSCRPPPASEETSRAPRERSCLATALSAACQAGDRPLTLSVAPRFIREPRGIRGASAGSAAPSSKGATSATQSVFHRQVLPGSAFADH